MTDTEQILTDGGTIELTWKDREILKGTDLISAMYFYYTEPELEAGRMETVK